MKNIIEGNKIVFSHFTDEYCEIITEKQWDNDFLRHLTWDSFHPWRLDEWKEFVGKTDSNSRFLFALLNKENNEFIGWISLSDVQFKNRGADLSIAIIDKENRNKGFGKDAIQMICNFAFFELGLHKIRLSVHANNIPAIRSYEAIGFKKEGIDREALFQDGTWLDVINYGILAQEWE